MPPTEFKKKSIQRISKRGIALSSVFLFCLTLSACTTTGDKYRASSYRATQVNQKQAEPVAC